MRALHDKLLAEAMNEALATYMSLMPNERTVEYMKDAHDHASRRIWAAINFTAKMSEGFRDDALKGLSDYLDEVNPPKESRTLMSRLGLKPADVDNP